MTSCTSTLWELIPNTDCRHQAYSITGCAQALTYMYTSTVHIHTCTHTQDFASSPVPSHTSTQTTQPRPHCSSDLLSRQSPDHLPRPPCPPGSVLFLVCLAPYLQLMGQSGTGVCGWTVGWIIKRYRNFV